MNLTRIHCGVVLAGVLVAGLVGFAKQRTLPSAANGEISGVVSTAGSQPIPLRRAVVSISSDALAYARSAITDDAGRFAFTRLPAGAYTISAKKAAYLVTEFGSVRPGRRGSPLALANGERRAVTLTMFRGAAIGGALINPNGTPLSGVNVMAMLARSVRDNGRVDAEMATTNDRGEYRVYGLMPGEYVVVALPSVGGTGEIGARSAAETDALLAALAQRRTSSNSAPASSVLAPAARVVGYSPIYFPGTPLLRDAETVRVAAGDDRDTVRFPVPRVPVASIEGTVSGDVPSLAGIQLAIVPEANRVGMRGGFPSITGIPPNQDGVFKYGSVSPGRYQIVARARRTSPSEPPPTPPPPSGGGGGARIGGAGPPGVAIGTGEFLFAVADIEVRGQDIKGLSLSLQPGGFISGSIAFDAGSAPAPTSVAGIRVGVSVVGDMNAFQQVGIRVGNILSDVPLVPVGADSTFLISGLGPSHYALTVMLPPALEKIWRLRSAMVNGQDLLDADLNGLDTRLRDVKMTFSDKRTELVGSLLSESGQPASAYHVIVFSADRANWRPGSRRTLAARPATDGRFAFTDLPAGEYLVAALTDLDPDQWQESSFLEQVAPVAIKIRISEGEKKSQDLKIK